MFPRARRFGGENKRVGVAGAGAGGNLAAAVAIVCRDVGINLAAQLLVDPVADVDGNFADAKENARFPRARKTRKAISCRQSWNGSPATISVTRSMARTARLA
jgi:acetyl esterase/lipase